MKELARSMGGNLSIESKPGKGTVVSCVVMAGMSDNFILNATGTAGKGEH